MSQIHKFISVLKPATSSGNVVFNFQAPNRSPGISITSTVPILTSDTEEGIAAKIAAQLLVTFGATYTYTGDPDFNRSGPRVYSFTAIQTDHIVSLFNQAQFSATVTTGTGARIEVLDVPVFAKLSDADEIGPIVNASFKLQDGTPFTEAQKVRTLRMGSQELVNICGEYLVATTYMHEEHGFMNDGFYLEHTPILTYDDPRIRGSNFAVYSVTSGTPIESGYRVDSDTGFVMFTPLGVEPMKLRAADRHNFIMMSYVAGLNAVVEGLRMETIRSASYFGVPLIFSELKGGTGVVKLNQRSARAVIRDNLISLGYM